MSVRMLNIPASIDDANYRYQMPALLSQTEGRGNGVKTNFTNIKDVASALERNPPEVLKFFGCELGGQSNYTDKPGEGCRATVQGKHDNPDLQDILDRYIRIYVLCGNCGLPEMDLKVKPKDEEISGKCRACGWGGYLEQATTHKLAPFMYKNHGKNDDDGGKKLSKAERQAMRAAKARGEDVGGGDDDSDDDDGGKKKKKKDKKKKGGEDDDEDGAKKKKKKSKKGDGDDDDKKKKKKKDKKKKGDDSDSEDGNKAKSSCSSSPKEDDDGHRDDEVLQIIAGLRTLKTKDPENSAAFVELVRNQCATMQADNKMRLYMVLEALFGEPKEDEEGFCKFNKASVEKYSKFLTAVKADKNFAVKDLMWACETYEHEHADVDAIKGFPMACKALYDLELFEEKAMVSYYDDDDHNTGNPGHKAVRKALKAFVEWLKEDDSDSSGSDSD